MELTSRGELLLHEKSLATCKRMTGRRISPAVHHCHQKGIIHRSKTGNYLAGLHER
jgi:hypothetical protein